ncbi:MAG: single-stranded DNA-binding protein [Bacteroidota bacterium]|nr:single-stranded DNA-binding protein [Bacteroidota bacterium]
MASINKVILIGNLGKDPEVRHFENGGSLARFSLATSETYTNKETNEKVTQTEWHTVVTRGGLASKVVEPYLKKGNSVYIEGKLRTRSWEDKDGVTRYTTEVLCDSLEMLGKKSDHSESSISEQSATTPLQDSPDDDLPF